MFKGASLLKKSLPRIIFKDENFVKCRLVKRIAPHDYHTCTVVCTMLKSAYSSIKCYG